MAQLSINPELGGAKWRSLRGAVAPGAARAQAPLGRAFLKGADAIDRSAWLQERIEAFGSADRDGDRSVSAAEAADHGVERGAFERADRDGSGAVEVEEFRRFLAAHARHSFAPDAAAT